MMISLLRSGGLLAVLALLPLGAAPVIGTSPRLQTIVDGAVRATLAEFTARSLKAEHLAVTLVDLRDPVRPVQASVRGDLQIYPASVIKLFYLAAAHRWMEDGRLADTPELRRAMRDMIVDSSNDATHYVIDLLTGTTSGPELSDAEIAGWFDKREAVSRYFSGLGYTNVIANKKPWGDGPYGRESQAIRLFQPKRNMLSTEATARLLVEIATGNCVTGARSAQMLELLVRDPATKVADPDDQAKFTGPAVPPGAKLWSKAGWTSKTRHDGVLVELPDGGRYVLVTFTTDHASEREIIRSVARSVFAALGAR
jgi:beta-lactamase class A